MQIRPSPGEILAEMRKSKFVKGWAFQVEFAGALSNMFDVLMPAPHRTILRTTNEPQKKASRKANKKGGILQEILTKTVRKAKARVTTDFSRETGGPMLIRRRSASRIT